MSDLGGAEGDNIGDNGDYERPHNVLHTLLPSIEEEAVDDDGNAAKNIWRGSDGEGYGSRESQTGDDNRD